MYINRSLEKPLRQALEQFPVVLITGARQAGKSTFLQHSLKEYRYISFDDTLARTLAEEDPALFLKTYKPPLILDEIQYVPALLSHIKMAVDHNRHANGQYVLTGSQIFPLMKGASESLAGRTAIFQLLPFSWEELHSPDIYEETAIMEQMLRGFYPEFQVQPNLNPTFWHDAYLSTYLERDLRLMRHIQDLGQFQRFLILLAARAGQLLNLSEIGKECGISQPTAKGWLALLTTASIVYLLEPYARNITKRVVKSPKLFFVDTGLLCYLLRIETVEQLIHSPFRGHLFENMVIMEAVKHYAGEGKRAPCYFYRTASGLEIDLIIDHGERLDAYEIKCSSSPTAEMGRSLVQFKKEYPVLHSSILTLHPNHIPLSRNVSSEHWSAVDSLV